MNITGTTDLYGLIGKPVSHSISPMMHNLSFDTLGLDAVYLCFECGEDELETMVSGLKALDVRGWNCTLPVKTKMASLVNQLSPAAEYIGAVNTVVNDHGVLTGYNTDGIGFMKSVCENGYDIIGKKMTLLGTGGAATSIMVQAALDGVNEIAVFGRNGSRGLEHAKGVVARLNQDTKCRIHLYTLDQQEQMKKEISQSDILVNGTNIGMSPDVDASPIPDNDFFHPGLLVYDVIYHPGETKMLQMAKQSGCTAMNGLYMLLYQGAEAFYLWTGEKMPVEQVKNQCFAHKRE